MTTYKLEVKFMLNNHSEYRYETPYKGTFVITHWFINGKVNLQYVPTKIRYNIRRIKPYTSDTNIEDISSKNMSDHYNI